MARRCGAWPGKAWHGHHHHHIEKGTTVGLRTEIDKIADEHPDENPRRLAGMLLDRLDRDDLVTLLADEIAWAQRSQVRAVERAVFTERFRTTSAKVTADNATVDNYRALFDCSFKLGDTTVASWEKATEEQHLQRIAFLEKIRDGLDVTISMHREAVRLIRAHNVNCLGDIDQAVAA